MAAYLAFGIFIFFNTQGQSIFCIRKLLPKVIFSMENVWVTSDHSSQRLGLHCQQAANHPECSQWQNRILAVPGPSSAPLPTWRQRKIRQKGWADVSVFFLSSTSIKSASLKSWEWLGEGFSGRFFPLSSPHGEAAVGRGAGKLSSPKQSQKLRYFLF